MNIINKQNKQDINESNSNENIKVVPTRKTKEMINHNEVFMNIMRYVKYDHGVIGADPESKYDRIAIINDLSKMKHDHFGHNNKLHKSPALFMHILDEANKKAKNNKK